MSVVANSHYNKKFENLEAGSYIYVSMVCAMCKLHKLHVGPMQLNLFPFCL